MIRNRPLVPLRHIVHRGKEQVDNRDKEKKESWLRKHEVNVHGGDRMEWDLDVLGTFRKNALGRQVFEGVRIRNCPAYFKLNSKEEFVQPGEVTPTYTSAEVQKRARR